MNQIGELRRIQRRQFILRWVCFSLSLWACFLVSAESENVLIPYAPLRILHDSQFTPDFGVVGGSGTPDDPYVISGHEIDATDTSYGIYIEGTTKSFRIENCSIVGATAAAIKLVGVHDAAVSDCRVESSGLGIELREVERSSVHHNFIRSSEYFAICLAASCNNTISTNTMLDGSMGFRLVENSTNNTISDNVVKCLMPIRIDLGCGGNSIYRNDFYRGSFDCGRSDAYNRWQNKTEEGNYWECYFGEDSDQDGVGDVPHRIPGESYEQDLYPAMSPFYPDGIQ